MRFSDLKDPPYPCFSPYLFEAWTISPESIDNESCDNVLTAVRYILQAKHVDTSTGLSRRTFTEPPLLCAAAFSIAFLKMSVKHKATENLVLLCVSIWIHQGVHHCTKVCYLLQTVRVVIPPKNSG